MTAPSLPPGTRVLRLYLDGEEVETAQPAGSLNDGNVNEIKLSNQDGTETLEGLLDEVRVYPRAASAAEIAELAAMNGGGTCSGEL